MGCLLKLGMETIALGLESFAIEVIQRCRAYRGFRLLLARFNRKTAATGRKRMINLPALQGKPAPIQQTGLLPILQPRLSQRLAKNLPLTTAS